jgi:two-component system cell cycle sensor histidine kinase/response regulator CckA
MKLAAIPQARDSQERLSLGAPPLRAEKNAPRSSDLGDDRARRQTEKELRRFASIVESSDDAIVGQTLNGIITTWNAAAERMYGYSVDEVMGKPVSMLAPGARQEEISKMLECLKRGETIGHFETIRVTKGGTEFPIEISVSPIRDAMGRTIGASTIGWNISVRKRREEELSRLVRVAGRAGSVSTMGRDPTERRDLPEMFRHAQKMQAVGQLASGVAHDFNNLLGVILGYTGLLLEHLSEDDPQRKDIEQIQKAGDRAVQLTRQLLAFIRKQVFAPRVLDLNAVVQGAEKLLERLIGEDIELVVILNPGLGRVKADAGQLEQIIMNLAVNARDAMPAGGRLTIETTNVDLDEEYAAGHAGVTRGPHVMMAVSDTGCGMDAETKAHMFDPFFTTKPLGKGTGLGLTTVYGIVQQTGGSVCVHSEIGAGTTFQIYIPVAGAAVELPQMSGSVEKADKGSQTILVVEDDAAMLRVTHRSLEEVGYAVLAASSAAEATRISENYPGPIHLMVRDVIMPAMSGTQLALGLCAVRPEMKVLYISGYTDNHIVHHGVQEPGLAFLQKPFSPQALARKVSEVLAAASPFAEPASLKK